MPDLPLRHALVLGLLHGPTELLPISSSAHTTLVPWLAGWPYEQLEPKLRKSFEVALHTGTAVALLLRPPCKRQPVGGSFLVAALGPPALAGYALGGQIEQRLGTPVKIAAGLLAGSVAMGSVEARERKVDTRPVVSANTRDGLVLGLAQALALIPGVSRSGATLAAARARGFSRSDADQLSWTVGLPVIAGATLLQGTRLARRQARTDRPAGTALPLVVGAASSFLSTLASSKMLDRRRRAQLLPASIGYRGVLAAYVIRRMRDNT
jgi:undecaprenyl-diphosphatase